ncbi:MAG: DJ-1/PfpI family protein [Treponema sp.]|nr:DJ-1/PfpI family protein [Treponema sp.]
MVKKAVCLLADGFEDVEAITPVDYLRRAGAEVTTVSISNNLTVTSRWGGIKLIADNTLAEFMLRGYSEYGAVIVPGGMPGAVNLASSREASALLCKMAADGKLICAICASPVMVLSPLGLLAGKKFTCYPGMEEKAPEGLWQDDRVVVDGNIITSRAAGTAGEFAIAIINELFNEEAGKKISGSVLLK